MIIVNVKDQTCEIQQNTANFQLVVKSDVLIHHSNHLPTVVNSAVGVETKENSNRLPFQVCPQSLSIPHFAKNVKQKQLQFFGKNPLDKRGVISYNRDRKRAYQ